MQRVAFAVSFFGKVRPIFVERPARPFPRIARATLRLPNQTCLVALSLCLACLPAAAQTGSPAPAESDAAVVLTVEKAYQKFYVSGNLPELEKLMSPDYLDIEQEIMDRAQVLALRRKLASLGCKALPIKMQDPKVVFLAPDIATIVYHAMETATCAGHSVSGETKISTVWVRRDGHWLMHIHTETTDLSKSN